MSEFIHLCSSCELKENCMIGSKAVGIIAGCPGYMKAAPTNADRFRNMTDEELAVIFAAHASCYECPLWNGNACYRKDCKGHWLDWLQQESET